MSSAMAPAAGSPHQGNIRLEGVEVDYANERPNKRLKFVITVNGREPIKHGFGRSGTVAWNGSILCPTLSTLIIDVYEKRKLIFWKRSARFETPLDAIGTSSISLTDASTRANAKLSFSGLEDTDVMEVRRIEEDTKIAREKTEAKQTILDKLGKVRSLIDIIKPIGEAVSGIHPAIDAAFAGVGFLIEACEKQDASKEAAVALAKEWDDFLSISDHAHVLKEREETRKAVKSMLEVIAEAASFIRNHTTTALFDDLFTQGYEEKIGGFKEKFAKAMEDFKLSLQVEAVKGVHVLEQGRWLDLLKPALEAHYKPDGTCLKDTRLKLLLKASEWLRGVYEPSTSSASFGAAPPSNVFWLHGMAGSGKSSVANSVAEMINADEDLNLTCFFCKRDDPDLSNPKKFFPTLAYRIAHDHAAYRALLAEFLSTSASASIATSGITTQFDLLFKDRLPKVADTFLPHVIVIDALDECGTPAEQGELAGCIFSLAKAAPWIKVFITSRPVGEIRKHLTSYGSCNEVNINDEADTDADIERFIGAELDRLKTEEKMESTLSPEEIGRLVRQAAGLFIWASTLFKYVSTSINPRRELQTFLSEGVSKEPLEQLYGLYNQVLELAVNPSHKADVEALHAILGIVFVSAGNRPLSVEALSCFLRVNRQFEYEDRTSVRNMTRALHAVLYEDVSSRNVVRVHHPSFLDFLEERLKDWFSSGIENMHRFMFRGCLETMEAELKFNICHLEDSTLLNKDVPGLSERIRKSIPEALHYSSLFWFPHLSRSGLKHDEKAQSSVYTLLCSEKSIFWLEALSLLRAVGQGVAILRDCTQFFEGSPDIADVASDLERFVLSSSEAMESTPHLYLSALSWVPEETLTRKKVAVQFKNLHWITRKDAIWEGTRWIKSFGTVANNVACSPDGRFVVNGTTRDRRGTTVLEGTDDDTVRILDSGTGELVGVPLQCGKSVESFSFSPDGERITIVSSNTMTVWNTNTAAMIGDPLELEGPIWGRITAAVISPNGSLIARCSQYHIGLWDSQTGAAIGKPFVGHTAEITSIAFSPDERHLVSGSEDKTIRIWDVKTGTAVGNALEGHEGWVSSVSYSPDGRCIATSGSWDSTVRIWNLQTGAALLLLGHSSAVHSAVFSPDGRWVASGSDDRTIRIWEAMTGMPMVAPLLGHSYSVSSVAFTPDGRHIVSGSDDGTVRMWDVGFGAAAGGASEGHSEHVVSVSYSPDGEHIVSGSHDGTVRIWSTKTGAAVASARHEDDVNSVCLSPDGLLVASASDDQTICLWDAVTGAAVGEPLIGHTGPVRSIAFSPGGQHLVSGSRDKTIRIWDVKTGMAVGNPLEGHEEGVESVSYSPDGRCIASGSWDKTVRIWNPQTGAALLLPGHFHAVHPVVFSQDGRWLVSGSGRLDYGTIQVWDANTGAAMGDPLHCHGEVLSMAFSSDSRRLLFSFRYDGAIHIWDVQTRVEMEIPEPLVCHSFAVYAIAISPDGQHIATGSADGIVRIWDHVHTAPVAREGFPLTDAHWNLCCARMNIEDGWVKDGEKLLLWIPHRYRKFFESPRLQLFIARGERCRVKAEVDLEQLFAYTGIGWTRFYEQ